MFNNIKKKFGNVIQEGIALSENISSQYLNSSPSDISRIPIIVPPDINLSAGCNILRKFESDWADIHKNNEENAEKAENVDVLIEKIKMRSDKDNIDISDLKSCLIGIPAIIIKLQTCGELLNDIKLLCQSAEKKLIELDDICEQCELQEIQLEAKFQLSLYKQKKMSELENFRKNLAAKHELNVRQFETDLRKIQQERQAVFQDAFLNDMEAYKKAGSLPRTEKETTIDKTKNDLTPEEVVLDDVDTKDLLEEFLNS